MSQHPANLALRFFLELAALFGLGLWGWAAHTGLARWLWMLGLPLAAAVLWGTFRVPNDPGPAPVAVPGLARLMVEALVLGGGVWGFYAAGRGAWALAYGVLLLIHYAASYDRVMWMLGLRPRPGG
jgi:hypothetical protein